jgi:predicted metalloprotease
VAAAWKRRRCSRHPPARPRRPPADDKAAAFASTVLRDTELVWGKVLQAGGNRYQEPQLVLFRGYTPTACGTGDSAMGPFYCPGDAKVYLDLDFFDTLSQRMGAPGDFAQAYVIAHEVGHHLQNLMGITGKVDAHARARVRAADERAVGACRTAGRLPGRRVGAPLAEGQGLAGPGDIEEGLNAASQIGDDTLQKASRGRVSCPRASPTAARSSA